MNIGYIPYTGVIPATQKYCYSLRRVVVYLMQDITRMFKKVCYVETPFIPGESPPLNGRLTEEYNNSTQTRYNKLRS